MLKQQFPRLSQTMQTSCVNWHGYTQNLFKKIKIVNEIMIIFYKYKYYWTDYFMIIIWDYECFKNLHYISLLLDPPGIARNQDNNLQYT